MNRVLVTGDIHGDCVRRFSSHNFPIGTSLDRFDLVFVAGDFGVIFNQSESNLRIQNYRINWLNSKPWTTLVVGGNHENWDILNSLPTIEKFGVTLGVIAENIFFVPNGTIINYGGRKIFCFGGAMSTDRGGLEQNTFYPEEGKSWWRAEIPSVEQMQLGIDNLEKGGNKVDIVITHTMPVEACLAFKMKYGYHAERSQDPTARYLSFLRDKLNIQYHSWYCGHFHLNNVSLDGITVIYHNIIDVDDGVDHYHGDNFERG